MLSRIMLFGQLLLLAPSLSIAAFVLEEKERVIAPDASITETVWRAEVPPGGKFDVIGLHRFRLPDHEVVASMLYLPGTNMNGELAITDEHHNLWLYLAARGIVVYTLDYRTHAVPDDYRGPFDFMEDWTLARFTDDAEMALEFMKVQSRSAGTIVAGFSRGVTFAYALAGRKEFDGLVALDGSFKEFQPGDYDRKTALSELHKRGQYASILSRSRGWDNRQALMRRAWQDPDGPPLDDRFSTAAAQLSATLYNAWGPGGLANPKAGISQVEILARLMEGYDRFYPMIQNIQGRALASYRDDPQSRLDDHFGDMTIPVIYFGTTNLGVDHLLNGIYSAGYSGSDDVTIQVLENFGHLDVLVADRAPSLVYGVIFDWIRERR